MSARRKRQEWVMSAFVSICALAALAAISFGVAHDFNISFSYWLDEMYSAEMVYRSYFDMLIRAGGDVHPPLYYSSLWLWTQAFGIEEIATRSLSVLAIVGAIIALVTLRPKLSGLSFIFLLFFFLLNPLIYFYAIEARSYAFLVFLSALVLVCELRGWVWAAILVSAALGLTHYFGTLVALATLGRLAFRNRSANLRIGASVAAVVILIWPLLQLTITGVKHRTGGNFWIQAKGSEVFADALDATLPALSDIISGSVERFGGDFLWVHPLAVSLFLMVLSLPALASRRTTDSELKIAADMALIILVVVIAVFIISFHTPMATTRNFIVLVPHMSLVAAVLCRNFTLGSMWRSALIAFFTLGYAINSSDFSKQGIARKIAPYENWRSMAQVAASIADERAVQLGNIYVGDWIQDVYTWYLPEDIDPVIFEVSVDWTLVPSSVVMFYDIHCDLGERLQTELEKSGRLIEVIETHQSQLCGGETSKNLVFVIGN